MKQNRSSAANILALAIGVWCCMSPEALAAGPLAIQGATIITVSGGVIEQGTVLMRDGVIEAIGTEIDVPGEALVIDGTGKVVMPGIIDAHNAAGMSQANEQAAVVPFLSVVDSIDPVATYFEECRRNGITSAAVVPGNSTLIGGKAAIVKTAGQYVNDMLVRRDSALKLSLRPTSGSRMSQMALLRKELDAAKRALQEQDDGAGEGDEKPADKESSAAEAGPGEDSAGDGSDEKEAEVSDENSADDSSTGEDIGLEALKLAVQGKLPVYIYCEVAMDVAAAVKLVADYGLNPIYVLGQDCYQAAKLLAAQGKTVILDPTLVYWKTNPRSREDEKIELPSIYHDAGVNFIFQTTDSNARTTLGTSYFWYQAATAVKHGIPEREAIAALTLEPAKLLGIDDRVGSIEVGKEADLIILTGQPLDIATWVDMTIVGGQVVYEREQDEKLKRLLSPEAE
ncbi:MAG: amidohydrolase family protein [Planctomycetales bacterium]|nr:amidohydrolase family protein [Planctomycetales bacterium]